MEILKTLKVDILESHNPPVVDAVVGEKNSRRIAFNLMKGGLTWLVPDGTSAYISYKKPDGFGGFYDVLSDGSTATSIVNYTVTITLAEQVLTTAGKVDLSVNLISDDEILSTFPIIINVHENPGADVVESDNYFNLSVAINAAIAASASPVFIINISQNQYNEYEADVTIEAIEAAFNANKCLLALSGGSAYHLNTRVAAAGQIIYRFSQVAISGYLKYFVISQDQILYNELNLVQSGGGGSGQLGDLEKNLMLTLFKKSVYVEDVSDVIESLEIAWATGGGDDGNEEEDGVYQIGDTLFVRSGVTISQSNRTLSIS